MLDKKEIIFPPHLNWTRGPTPIHKLPRLSHELGAEIYIKRDDLTGFATSGNKIRKLDFLFQEAFDKKATAVISCGGIQSNHCRAVAAVAAHYGLECILILRGEKKYPLRSNLLLDHLFGAQILYVSDEEYEKREVLRRSIESQVRDRGGSAYYIPEGGSNPLGSFGYIQMWKELIHQYKTIDTTFQHEIPSHFDSIVHATGSGGTQCGLILGKILYEQKTRIIGVNVCYDKKETHSIVKDVLWNTIQQRVQGYSFFADDIEFLDGFIGTGYAESTEEELKFLSSMGKTEGILLDPVYSGKAFFGLYQTLKKDPLYFGKNILFLHTGGGFGNFKLENEWDHVL